MSGLLPTIRARVRAPSACKLAIEDNTRGGDGLVGVESRPRELPVSCPRFDVDTVPEWRRLPP